MGRYTHTPAHTLPRVIASAAQCARRVRGLGHVPERTYADAALHVGQESAGGIRRGRTGRDRRRAAAGTGDAGGAYTVRRRLRRRPRGAGRFGGQLQGCRLPRRRGSGGRRTGAVADAVRPQKIPDVGQRKDHHDALQNGHVSPSFKRRLTSPDTWRCIRPPTSSSSAPSQSTPRTVPSMVLSPASTRASRPASASSLSQSS
jgi:hypothetical protein